MIQFGDLTKGRDGNEGYGWMKKYLRSVFHWLIVRFVHVDGKYIEQLSYVLHCKKREKKMVERRGDMKHTVVQ